MSTPKAETKLSSSHRCSTTVTLTRGPRHRALLSLLRHSKEEKKGTHMDQRLQCASPKHKPQLRKQNTKVYEAWCKHRRRTQEHLPLLPLALLCSDMEPTTECPQTPQFVLQHQKPTERVLCSFPAHPDLFQKNVLSDSSGGKKYAADLSKV